MIVVVVWAVSGPAFRFSDTWQLAINTKQFKALRQRAGEALEERRR